MHGSKVSLNIIIITCHTSWDFNAKVYKRAAALDQSTYRHLDHRSSEIRLWTVTRTYGYLRWTCRWWRRTSDRALDECGDSRRWQVARSFSATNTHIPTRRDKWWIIGLSRPAVRRTANSGTDYIPPQLLQTGKLMLHRLRRRLRVLSVIPHRSSPVYDGVQDLHRGDILCALTIMMWTSLVSRTFVKKDPGMQVLEHLHPCFSFKYCVICFNHKVL